MKRIATIILCLIMAAQMTACGKNVENRDPNQMTNSESAVVSEKNVEKKESTSKEEKTEEIVLEKISIEVSEVGQIIEFGHYEQDGDLTNGMEPIEWEVLSIEDGRALLISKYVLDEVSFSGSLDYVPWENSLLRAWLHNTFLVTAFTEAEQNLIPIVTISNPGNEQARREAVADTMDQVFVLSVEEILEYYDFYYFDDEWGFALSEELFAAPTEYAISQGVRQSIITEDSFDWLKSVGCSEDVIGTMQAQYWLRTPSKGAGVCCVGWGGMAGEGCFSNNLIDGQPDGCSGVRPAIYVNIAD